MVCVEECLLDGLSTADGAVVSEKHDFVVHSQVLGQPVLLGGLHHEATVRVERDVTQKAGLLT